MVTAGLKCAPETWLKATERIAMASPEASAPPRTPPPAPCRKRSAQIAPAPKKTSAKVPRNSATSFCVVLYTGISRATREANDRILAGESWPRQRHPRIDVTAEERPMAYANRVICFGAWTQMKNCDAFEWLSGGCGDGRIYRREPVVAVGLGAAGDREKLFL